MVESFPTALSSFAKLLHKMPDSTYLIGVYFLCDEDEVVYIGQSTNVIARISAHLNEYGTNISHGRYVQNKCFDRAYWINVPQTDLNEVEGALIQFFKPRLNGKCGHKLGRSRKRSTKISSPICKDKNKVLSDLGLLSV